MQAQRRVCQSRMLYPWRSKVPPCTETSCSEAKPKGRHVPFCTVRQPNHIESVSELSEPEAPEQTSQLCVSTRVVVNGNSSWHSTRGSSLLIICAPHLLPSRESIALFN